MFLTPCFHPQDMFQSEDVIVCSLSRKLWFVASSVLESAVWDLFATALLPGGVAKLSQRYVRETVYYTIYIVTCALGLVLLLCLKSCGEL